MAKCEHCGVDHGDANEHTDERLDRWQDLIELSRAHLEQRSQHLLIIDTADPDKEEPDGGVFVHGVPKPEVQAALLSYALAGIYNMAGLTDMADAVAAMSESFAVQMEMLRKEYHARLN